MKKLFIFIFFLLLIPNLLFAQEQIAGFEKKDLPVLNEELRKINTTLRNLISYPLAITSGGTGKTTAQTAIDALLPSQTGNSGKFLTTDATNASWGTVTTQRNQLFTSSGTFTAPTGVTKVYLTMSGGGGGGGGGKVLDLNGGGGGGGAAYIIRTIYTVVAESNYTVTVGTGGAGGAGGNPGNDGSTGNATVFDSAITCAGGIKGIGGTEGTGGAGGAAVSINGSGVTAGNVLVNVGGTGGTYSSMTGGGGAGSPFGTGGVNASGTSTSGSGYGSGGGGGSGVSAQAGNGGTGAAGFVLVEW